MSKRTNKIYNVQVVQCAWMAIEAESPEEAMNMAKELVDENITDEDFEDSGVYVQSCETYASEIDDFDSEERIFTKDGVKKAGQYRKEMEG